MTTLSALSRITSSSYSFHPRTDSSIITSEIMLASRPPLAISISSSRLYATPLPVPPKVKEARTIIGNPISSAILRTSLMERAKPLLGTRKPMFSIACRNFSRSSALWITLSDAPIISTPYFFSTPLSASATAVLRPVCPPTVGNNASGRSRAIIFSTASGVMGSI